MCLILDYRDKCYSSKKRRGEVDLNQFILIFKKVGGKEILKQYCRAHVLLFALVETTLLGFSKKSLEIVRLSVNNRILNKLRRKYKSFILQYMKEYNCKELSHVHGNKVWVCWLQGIENAPRIVQKCYHSLQKNIHDKEIILLTEENYRDYVQFPSFIQKKIDSGIIKGAHMTDLLRLELLIRYGGTWIDATVYCSGGNYPDYLLNSDLFLYQCLKPGLDGHSTCISNWMMTASSNNCLLLLTRALLYEYWSQNNKLINYFIFHDMFQLAIETYPEEWKKVIPFSNSTPHILLLRLFEEYNSDAWKAIKLQSCFHKLSYKFDKQKFEKENTYYKIIIDR